MSVADNMSGRMCDTSFYTHNVIAALHFGPRQDLRSVDTANQS